MTEPLDEIDTDDTDVDYPDPAEQEPTDADVSDVVLPTDGEGEDE